MMHFEPHGELLSFVGPLMENSLPSCGGCDSSNNEVTVRYIEMIEKQTRTDKAGEKLMNT